MTLIGSAQPKHPASEARLRQIKTTCASEHLVVAADLMGLDELLKSLKLSAKQLPALDPSNQFSFKTTRHFASKIRPNDPHDPLLKQILPLAEENVMQPGYQADPLQESEFAARAGLIHKYPSRVLLTVTGACAIHCRYCFRRHFDYQANHPNAERLAAIKSYVQAHPQINEVILSGGDPLVLSDQALSELLVFFESIEQIQTIRFHSRLPLLKPQRLSSAFFDELKHARLRSVLVIHANHPNEIDEQTAHALLQIKPKLSALLNQSVLLQGVNNCASTLTRLSERLFEAGVLPYYLHLLDPVLGAHHFATELSEAKTLYGELQTKLPGYLLPRLVTEQPHQKHKSLLL